MNAQDKIHVSGERRCPNCGDCDHFYPEFAASTSLGKLAATEGYHCLECGELADRSGVIITKGRAA